MNHLNSKQQSKQEHDLPLTAPQVDVLFNVVRLLLVEDLPLLRVLELFQDVLFFSFLDLFLDQWEV